jgi:hypothetical protein
MFKYGKLGMIKPRSTRQFATFYTIMEKLLLGRSKLLNPVQGSPRYPDFDSIDDRHVEEA